MEHEAEDHRPPKRSPRCIEDEHRISSLPDDILFSILSSLPLKDWLPLFDVSRKWRRLTLLLPARDFFRCHLTESDSADLPPFPRAFIRRLLLIDSRDIICWGEQDRLLLSPDLMERARDAAVEELELIVENTSLVDPCTFLAGLAIPDSVFHIKTLKALSIKHYALCTYGLENFGCTLLRTLKVEKSCIDEGVIKGVLACCRRLETLHLIDFAGLTELEIDSDSLKNLRLRPRTNVTELEGHSDSLRPRPKSVCIRAPNLRVLNLNLRMIRLGGLSIQAPKVQEISLRICDESVVLMTEFVWFLIAAKELSLFTLNSGAAEVIRRTIDEITEDTTELRGVSFTEAIELRRLQLILPGLCVEKVVGDILRASRDEESSVDCSGRFAIKMIDSRIKLSRSYACRTKEIN